MRNVGSILPVFLLTVGVCFGDCNQNPLKPSILPPCPTIADRLSQALDASREFKKDVAILNGDIGDARSRYWKVFPNGPGIAAAETAFLSQLQNKDLYYLMFSLLQGVTGDLAKMPNLIGMDLTTTSESLSKFPTNVDGGIRPYAFPLFVQWVNALRRSEGRDKDGTWASPMLIAKAVQDKSNWRKAYEDARNWAEFLGSGLDISKYVTPQVYLVNQMESHVSLSLARSKPEDLPDPKAASLDLYNLFVKSFGEKEVLAAATTLLHTPKNSMGGLAQRAEVVIGAYQAAPSPNPFLLFLTQLTNSSLRAYATALCLDPYALLGGEATATFNSKDQWAEAASVYGQLVAKFGEPAVLAAAGRLKDMPKDDKGGPRGDPESKGAIFWFTALLKDPKTPLPGVSHFLASSYDPRWMGKILEVRGTVSRVDVEKGFPPYATIHFKESKNDRFTAFTPNSGLLDRYGQNSSGLVGKPIEVWGQVEDWREGTGIRFLITSQLKVLDAGALVNFRESEPNWMKMPMPAKNLVDSPKYLAWKKFPVASKASYQNDVLHEYKPGTNQYTKSKISRITLTLQSIDDERAVVKAESTVSHTRGGDTYSSNQLTFKAKEAPPGAPVDDPPTVTTRGEETLVINGKKIPTKWECVAQADDPLTFTKTWTSDEVPGGLVRTQQQSHAEIAGGTYRDISQTLFAPIDGVEPQLGGATSSAPSPAGNAAPLAAPNRGTTPAVPTSRPQGRGVPAPAPAAPPLPRGRPDPYATSPASQAEFMRHYTAVMTRAAQDRSGLLQAQRKLAVAGTPLPDDIRAAADRLNSQQREVGLAMRTRDYAAAEQDLRALEDTLAAIEKFIGK
jgi:hypothetical protein